jgi:hypothetical protein
MSRLADSIDELRRRLRRGIAVRGMAWTAATLGGGVAVMAATDSLLDIENPWLRLALLLTTMIATGIVVWRQLVAPLAGVWDDVTIALLIERWYPESRDRLAAAAQFGRDSIASPDSPLPQRLRSDAEQVVPGGCSDRAACLPMAAAGLGVLATLGLVLGAWFARSPAQMVLAVDRQLRPFHAPDWPRSTVLAWLSDKLEPLDADDRLCVADETLTLYVTNQRGELPRDLQVLQREADGAARALEWTPTHLRDAQGQERRLAVVSISPSSGEFAIRASGGDDDTLAWLTFEAIPAPRIDRFEIRAIPPAYTALPEVVEDRTAAHLEGVLGTRFEVTAFANAPLSDALLVRDGASSISLPVVFNETASEFRAELTAEAEGRSTFWFEFTDSRGLRAARPVVYELRGRRDRPPEIRWLGPEAELTVTPQARLPLSIECSDDFGLGATRLTAAVVDSSDAAVELDLPAEPGESAAKSRRFEFVWNVNTREYAPGQRVEYSVSAADQRDPDPQVTRSALQTLVVVSPEEKLREIAGHQAGMASWLQRIESRHTAASNVLREVQTQWTIAAALQSADEERLQALAQSVLHLSADLTNERGGLAAQLRQVERELEWNRLNDPLTTARVAHLDQHLRWLVGDQLPEFGRRVSAAQRLLVGSAGAAAPTPSDPEQFAQVLRAAAAQHIVVGQTLAAMLAELDEWRQRSDTSRVLDESLALQRQVQARTGEVGRSTLSRSWEELAPQQQADLVLLADQQRDLGSTLQALVNERLTQSATAERHAADVPLPSDVANGRLAALMQQSAEFVSSNQIGQAQEQQSLIVAALETALEQVRTQDSADPHAQWESLVQTRQEVLDLRKHQADLGTRFESIRPLSSDVAEQEELQVLRKQHTDQSDALTDLAGEFQHQGRPRLAAIAARAAAGNQAASDGLEHMRPERVTAAQREALGELDELVTQLQSEIDRAELRRMAHLLLTVTDALPPLRARTLALGDETAALDAARQAAGRLGRAELKRLQSVQESLQAVAAEVRGLEESTAALELVGSQLRSVAALLESAASRLDERKTDQPTVGLQQSAAARMQILIDALQQDAAPEFGSAAASTTNSTNDPESAAVNWIEVKLLRNLQADLARRTEQWQQIVSGRSPNPDELAESEQLAVEQHDLAQQADRILKQHSDAIKIPPSEPSRR